MITLTKTAIQEVQNIIKDQGDESETMFLRVGVRGGGCSGYTYTLDLTNECNEERDEIFEHEGIKVICDPASHIYLDGATIDFQDGLMGRGFVFNNPQSTGKCGCGSSFSA